MMEKKALFIHGFHSDNTSTTGQRVSQILAELGYETIIPTLDLLDFEGTMSQIANLIETQKFDLIVGHSLGGFYAFLVRRDMTKILINPCLMPEVEIPKLLFEGESVCQELLQKWKTAREEKNDFDDIEIHHSTKGIFAKNDELFSYCDYMKKLGFRFVYQIEGGHKPEKEALAPVIKEALFTGWSISPAMAIPDEDF